MSMKLTSVVLKRADIKMLSRYESYRGDCYCNHYNACGGYTGTNEFC